MLKQNKKNIVFFFSFVPNQRLYKYVFMDSLCFSFPVSGGYSLVRVTWCKKTCKIEGASSGKPSRH